jgi:hypothetical protein
MDNHSNLETRISKIEARNAKVETDKKWEKSTTRRLLLMLFTYLSIFLYFLVIGIPNPFLNAVVPTLGYFLSTLTLPFFKRHWLEQCSKE